MSTTSRPERTALTPDEAARVAALAAHEDDAHGGMALAVSAIITTIAGLAAAVALGLSL